MAKSYRTAFIRISAKNNTKKGQIVYTKQNISDLLKEWADSMKMTYWMIEHEPDADSDNLHYHVVIRFSSPTPFESLKAKFPYGDIQSARSIKNTVQYLVHYNDPSKQQYQWDEVITNCEDMTKYKIKSDSQNEVTIQTVMEKIDKGVIREYNQFEMIPIELWAKYKVRIENALTYYRERVCMDKNREIEVIFMTGDTGTGKTTFAKEYCIKSKKSYCISSSSNDPMQDYKGEDVLILDDLRDTDFKFTDLLKILDNHTKSTVRSRYHNKAFIGERIIITSYKPLQKWYYDVPEQSRQQLFRRIQGVYEFTKEQIRVYAYNAEKGEYEYQATAPNVPMLSIQKQKEMVTGMIKAMGIDMAHDIQQSIQDIPDDEWEQMVVDDTPFNKKK